jgi:hypothetical protein
VPLLSSAPGEVTTSPGQRCRNKTRLRSSRDEGTAAGIQNNKPRENPVGFIVLTGAAFGAARTARVKVVCLSLIVSGGRLREDERIVLLAWPRSGSSSLWEILRAHSDLRLMADEPFNENFTDWAPDNPDYLGRIHDIESLDVVLDELFRSYRGIKVLSYQLDEKELVHLIRRPNIRLVYISRSNLLQVAVSDRVAKQTRVWNRWDVGQHETLERRYDSLAPLDLDDLRDYMRELAAHLAWIDSILSLRDDDRTLRLRYEDLYFATSEAQHAQLSALWSFLGLALLTGPDVDYYLNPRTAKLGSMGTYGQLPNAAQIDATLGSDETGWLFPLASIAGHWPASICRSHR